MEGLVREECFIVNPGLDRQPVEVDEGGGDMLPWPYDMLFTLTLIAYHVTGL